MRKFRRLYYKISTLFCLVATFMFLFNMDQTGVGYGCVYILAGLVSFGSWSIGKEEIDPEKPIRNIFVLLVWSLLGFGMMAMGITTLKGKANDESLMTMFLVLTGLGLCIAYVVSIIKNKDIYAILSIVLIILTCFLGTKSTGKDFLAILTLLCLFASAACFLFSFIKGFFGGDDD